MAIAGLPAWAKRIRYQRSPEQLDADISEKYVLLTTRRALSDATFSHTAFQRACEDRWEALLTLTKKVLPPLEG